MAANESCAEFVLGLYEAMFSDIVARCPDLNKECSRDYNRLLSAVDQMGVRFMFDVLPAFGKHFDKCLANGRLVKSGLAHFGPYRHDVMVPRLFKGLLLRVFDEFGCLRSDPDKQAIRDVRQLCSAVKRFRVDCPDSSVWKQTDEFYRIDGEVVPGSLNWNRGHFDPDGARDLQLGDHLPHGPEPSPLFGDEGSTPPDIALAARLSAVQRTADLVCAEFGRFNPVDWGARHGPGAVSDLKSGEYKYSFPTWPEKLERNFPMSLYGFANEGHWAESVRSGEIQRSFLDHEPPARLIAVPKSFSGPRLIASEPVAHQWCQQIIRDFLMSRVSFTSLSEAVDFRSQRKNQELARAASLTGSHSTIDLSSASDRISCWVVERMFRRLPDLLECFYSVRTRWIYQDIDKKSPKHHMLEKFSTMGSALTFPVQTIVFACIAIGTLLCERGKPVTYANIAMAAKEVQVFGDDIIVPIDCHGSVLEVLSHLRLKVNPDKTFSTGKFRESCGYDAYDGDDVSKVSVMTVPVVSKPESVLSSIDVHNNFLARGWYLTAKYVKKAVDSLKRFAFRWVHPDLGAIGWHSLFGERDKGLKTRWNANLQREEVLVTRSLGSSGKTPVDSDSMVLQYFTEVKGLPVSREERLGKSPLRGPLRLRWAWEPRDIFLGRGLSLNRALQRG